MSIRKENYDYVTSLIAHLTCEMQKKNCNTKNCNTVDFHIGTKLSEYRRETGLIFKTTDIKYEFEAKENFKFNEGYNFDCGQNFVYALTFKRLCELPLVQIFVIEGSMFRDNEMLNEHAIERLDNRIRLHFKAFEKFIFENSIEYNVNERKHEIKKYINDRIRKLVPFAACDFNVTYNYVNGGFNVSCFNVSYVVNHNWTTRFITKGDLKPLVKCWYDTERLNKQIDKIVNSYLHDKCAYMKRKRCEEIRKKRDECIPCEVTITHSDAMKIVNELSVEYLDYAGVCGCYRIPNKCVTLKDGTKLNIKD